MKQYQTLLFQIQRGETKIKVQLAGEAKLKAIEEYNMFHERHRGQPSPVGIHFLKAEQKRLRPKRWWHDRTQRDLLLLLPVDTLNMETTENQRIKVIPINSVPSQDNRRTKKYMFNNIIFGDLDIMP